MKAPLFITSLVVITAAFPLFAQANDNPYFTDNLDTAVKEAEEKPVSSAHVGNVWHNRTTAKSFDFPKLLNQEMSTEIVDGALDATASGPGDAAPERKSPLVLSETEATASEKDNNELELLSDNKRTVVSISVEPTANIEELEPTVNQIQRIEFKDGAFSGSTTNIRSSASSKAYIHD
jgi:hypothetical protein